MYESPIKRIINEAVNQIEKREEVELRYSIKQSVGYAVDKQELIKALQYDRDQYQKGYEDGLKQSKWIPVSERLPEIGQYILCSLIKAKDVKHRVIICEYKREVWWSYVTAWMPLPQPYKGESEDNG